jgi:hypothetical protein
MKLLNRYDLLKVISLKEIDSLFQKLDRRGIKPITKPCETRRKGWVSWVRHYKYDDLIKFVPALKTMSED